MSVCVSLHGLVPDGGAGALEEARLALKEDLLQPRRLDGAEEGVEVGGVEVLSHDDLLQLRTYGGGRRRRNTKNESGLSEKENTQ